MNKNNFDYYLLGRVLRLATPYRKIFAFAGLLAVVLAPLAILRPYLIKNNGRRSYFSIRHSGDDADRIDYCWDRFVFRFSSSICLFIIPPGWGKP